ncbi:MAG: phosphoglucosamine mutase [Paracoccaceae bacterium]|nr:phosphoglucosamine mutase [Paracoccaceae bacterium]
MTMKIFGTDGIRGKVNSTLISASFAQKIGIACGQYLSSKDLSGRSNRVIIGKDTRRSGYMLETALTSGFTSLGMDVFLLGPIPTPAVGMLTRSMRAELGVMITASHNHYEDNGIKFFGHDGFKLSDSVENEIETLLLSKSNCNNSDLVGRVKRIDEVLGRYIEFVKTSLPKNLMLNGLKIVIDCANGAAYKCAPQILWELGAKVIPLGVEPNGYNINLNCGSTDTSKAAELVKKHKADLGICLDGDADRVILLNEKGEEVDGDQLLGVLAAHWNNEERIAKGTIVSTVMSNLGLNRYLKTLGIKLHRAAVGDRYVVEAMRQKELNIGGEKSGHIVMTDHSTTGDGILAALHFLSILQGSGVKASSLLTAFQPIPQQLVNITFNSSHDPLENHDVKNLLIECESRLGKLGEMIVRKSGTEPVIRVMVQHDDEALVSSIVRKISSKIEGL